MYKIELNLEKSYTCNYRYNIYIGDTIFIYFSNFITRNKVIMIGVSNPRKSKVYDCKILLGKNRLKCNTSVMKLYNVNRHKNLTYIAIIVTYSENALSATGVELNKKYIPLIYIKSKPIYKIILVIVNFHNIKNYKQVIDVIELSRHYGVDHIALYVTSSTIFIKYILFNYLKTKYIELIPFCFNYEIKYVHATGQVEKINDALYRFINNTKYIIYNDIDEIIVPIKASNYISLINEADNYSSDMYLFKSKLFPYTSTKSRSIAVYHKSCFIKKGYEKYIVGNLYKFAILDVHIYKTLFSPIKINRVNRTYGYVRHTRYRGKMCRTNTNDNYLDKFKRYLNNIYKKYELLYNNDNRMYYYGK